MNNEQSIDRALVHHTCQGPFVNLPPSVGGQTIQRLVDLGSCRGGAQCVREYRVKAIYTWTGRYFGSSKVAPAIGLLAVAAAFSRSRHFMPVCVSSRTGS
jgi:hypothetical protein